MSNRNPLRDKALSLTIAACLLLTCSLGVLGFSPGIEYTFSEGVAGIVEIVATKKVEAALRVHQNITRETFKEHKAELTIKVGERDLTFTPQAIDEIAEADARADAEMPDVKEVHFDSETLVAGNTRLRNVRRNIVRRVLAGEQPDGAKARKFLGQALHTVQDFYSHSTWLNSGFPGIARLGEETPDLLLHPKDSITSGCILTGTTPTGPPLTTGYWFGASEAFIHGEIKPVFVNGIEKCRHGTPLERLEIRGIEIQGFGGINKDVPGRPLHSAAVERAKAATLAYLQLVLNDPELVPNTLGRCALLGVDMVQCQPAPIEVFRLHAPLPPERDIPGAYRRINRVNGSISAETRTTWVADALRFGWDDDDGRWVRNPADLAPERGLTVCRTGKFWIAKRKTIIYEPDVIAPRPGCNDTQTQDFRITADLSTLGVASGTEFSSSSIVQVCGIAGASDYFSVEATARSERKYELDLNSGKLTYRAQGADDRDQVIGGVPSPDRTAHESEWRGEQRWPAGSVNMELERVQTITYEGPDSIPAECH